MCGIAGFVGGEGDGHQILDRMCAAIAHRGPDGYGTHIDGALHLGHRRLAVVDLGGGAQPMWNETHAVCVIFNGEIYNHRDLRAELTSCGHQFASDHSDTEVLVHAWEEWGEALPIRLNGQFAFAIHDTGARKLFLARDRFGEKPLFYSHRPGFFAFASELPAMLAHPSVPRELDALALQKYFAHCYFPAPHTPYKSIRKLAAGCSMTLDEATCELTIRRYFRFDVEPDESLTDERALAEELRALVDRSVQARLDADVPVGILLSGGIDSSIVLQCARRYATDVKTFCIGFSEASFDESAYARIMSRHAKSQHFEKLCDLEQARNGLPELLQRIGEPIGDPSILPTHLVCEFARQQVTVALGGDGGDELFAGYDPFDALRASRLYRTLVPKAIHPALEALAGLLPISDRNMSLDFKIKRWLRGMRYDASLWNPVWMGALAPGDIAQLFQTTVDAESLYSEVLTTWESCGSRDVIDRTLSYFTNFYLADDILVKTDRASMQPSLELRAPFLDNDIATFASRLPHRFKIRGKSRKYLLKEAFRASLPAEILNRKKKGFGIPLAKWLREMTPVSTPLEGANARVLQDLWSDHQRGKADNRHALWCHLSLGH